LKEFTIGVGAFGKPDDYNPQDDPTVRVLASKLRHKLEDYYRSEGRENPVRIELPKGHYLLEFRRRAAHDAAPGAADRAGARKWWRGRWVLVSVLAGVLVTGAIWMVKLYQQEPTLLARTASLWTPELELIWRPYLDGSRPVLITIGTPLFTKF